MTLDNFDIVLNPGAEAWEEFSRLIKEHEGWVRSKFDYTCYMNGFGPGNFQFFAAINKETKQVAGGIIGSTYDAIGECPDMSCVGSFVVMPQYRGIGLGLALFDKLINTKQFVGRNQLLSSQPTMTQKYSDKYGFNKFVDWGMHVYKLPMELINVNHLERSGELKLICTQNGPEEKVPWDKIFEYERPFYGGVCRDRFIKTLLTIGEGSISKIAMDSAENVVGIASIKETYDNGLLVTPIYANNRQIAESLLHKVLSSFAASNDLMKYDYVALSTLSSNTEIVDLMKKLCGGISVETMGYSAVHFTKLVLEIPTERIYSVADYYAHIA